MVFTSELRTIKAHNKAITERRNNGILIVTIRNAAISKTNIDAPDTIDEITKRSKFIANFLSVFMFFLYNKYMLLILL